MEKTEPLCIFQHLEYDGRTHGTRGSCAVKFIVFFMCHHLYVYIFILYFVNLFGNDFKYTRGVKD